MKKALTGSLISLLSVVLLSCSNNAKTEIENTLKTFYKTHRTDYRTADKSLLSKKLSELIDKATEREKAEAEKIKNSDNTTDKPMMIEGDIFTSVYEGQDSFTIGEVTINGDQATAKVNFKNSQDNVSWQDEVVLINEDGWKIDNVVYKQSVSSLKNTQEVLLDLINAQE
jgi:hypothetical protein